MSIKEIKRLVRATQGKLTAVVSGEKPCRDERLIREYQSALNMRLNPYEAWISENEGKISENEPLTSENEYSSATAAHGNEDVHFMPPKGWTLVRTEDTFPAAVQSKIWVKTVSENPEAELIYGDEDCILKDKDGKIRRLHPFFKPDYSPETLESFNYFGKCIYIKNSLAAKLGPESESGTVYKSADEIYRFVLQISSEKIKIAHYPGIMSHRAVECIPQEDMFTEKSSLPDCSGVKAQPYFPRVNIVILSKDNPRLLEKCLESIRRFTDYPDYEISVTDNGSTEDNRLEYEKITEKYDAAYYYEPSEFNFSRLCNSGVKKSKVSESKACEAGKENNCDDGLILLMNDDVEVISPEYMKVMAEYAMRPQTGAVGAVLLYGDGKSIQHAGITLLKEAGPVHLLCGRSDERSYYFGRNRVTYNVSAVTAACMMVRKSLYDEMGGLDESFAVAYNDVDFCLRLIEKGYRNVLCGGVRLIHHESVTRGRDDDGNLKDKAAENKWERLKSERERLEKKHPALTCRDPYYNDNLPVYPGLYECNKLFPETDEKYFCKISRIAQKNDSETVKHIPGKNIRLYIQDLCRRRTADKRAEEILYVRGVILVTGADQINYGRCMVLKNTESADILVCECLDSYLPGTEKLIWSEKNAFMSGFTVKIKLDEIPKGDYIIGAQVTSRDGCKTGIHLSDRHFKKE